MIAYRFNENTKEFAGTMPCQLDPMASKRQGKKVYILPANSTFKEPPESEIGKAIIFENDNWQLVPDYRGRRAYNAEMLFTINYIGDLFPGDKLLTLEQIHGLDNGTLIFKDGEIIAKIKTPLEKIQELEKSITARNYREAILDPEGWAAQHIASINTQIEELRKELL